jgi:ribosome-associated heat shock protein Hsp15
MESLTDIRIDKWLWAVRFYKTRSRAIEACQAGHVKIDGQRVKPARPVRVGETLTVQIGELTRTLRVVGLIERRTSASGARQCLEDLTPPEAYAQARAAREPSPFHRPKGLGRPTKRDRRLLDLMQGKLE